MSHPTSHRPCADPLIDDASWALDPYPSYERLREAGPLLWSERFFGGAWLLTRHADVEALLRDPRFSAQRTGGWVVRPATTQGEFAPFQALFARALLFLDAPDHARLRTLLQAGFDREALARLRPVVERLTDEALNALPNDAPFDFMAQVARPLPLRVMAHVLGIADEDPTRFSAWSDDLAVFLGATAPSTSMLRRAQHGLLALAAWFEARLAVPAQLPPNSLLARLAQAQQRGELQGASELLAQCAMLLFAGHETTRNLLGNGLHTLLAQPQAWAELQRHPDKLPGAIRELLRFESPVQYTGRRVARALTLHGQKLARGDLVIGLIGSANRDPQRFEHADTFLLDRPDPGNLAFGSGPHACLGAAMSRMEAEIVFSRLLQRSPKLTLAESTPAWCGNTLYRGLLRLPVRHAADAPLSAPPAADPPRSSPAGC